MSNENLVINCGRLSLRSIGSNDLELLRIWRNQNRDAFFHRETIEAFDQAEWFSKYLSRNNDFLFIVEHAKIALGCIGLRWVNDSWDVYNLMRGTSYHKPQGEMGIALNATISFVLTRKLAPVKAIVIATNPALNWYLRQGFEVISEFTKQNESCVILHWIGAIKEECCK